MTKETDGQDNSRSERPGRGLYLRFLPIAVILAIFAVGYALGWHERVSLQKLTEERETLKDLVADNPILGPVGFMLLYAVAVTLFFPAKAVLTVIAGLLFGWLAGAFYAAVAATVGGTVLFLAARTAFGGFLSERAGGVAERLAHGFEKDAFSYLLALRLAPFIPFFAVSIAPALCNVRLRTFLAATLTGGLPVILSFTWLGQGLDSVLIAAKAEGRHVTPSELVTPEITIALLALTLVVVLATIVRKVRGLQAY